MHQVAGIVSQLQWLTAGAPLGEELHAVAREPGENDCLAIPCPVESAMRCAFVI